LTLIAKVFTYHATMKKHIALVFNPESPWFQRVFPGVVRYAQEQGDWLLEFMLDTAAPENITIADGMISGLWKPRKSDPQLPFISLAPHTTPFVCIDNVCAGRMAAEHLIERGYRELLFFQTGDTRDPVPFLREDGFRQAARDAGLELTVFSIGKRTRKRKKWILEDQLRDLADLLQSLKKPIGASACNPQHIHRLHSVCEREGLRIPEEIGIVSPTENSVILPFLEPGISSVLHDDEQMGYEAARLLHKRMQGEAVADETRIPPKDIFIRSSTDHRILSDPKCEEIVNYIWDHLEKNPTTTDLAQHFHLSERTLYRRFEEHVGRTPSEELRHARIETAKRLLRSTSLPLIDIALECGYGGQSQFNRDFKKTTGITPGAMRS
jgi:LacI family transcriptional regulator